MIALATDKGELDIMPYMKFLGFERLKSRLDKYRLTIANLQKRNAKGKESVNGTSKKDAIARRNGEITSTNGFALRSCDI